MTISLAPVHHSLTGPDFTPTPTFRTAIAKSKRLLKDPDIFAVEVRTPSGLYHLSLEEGILTIGFVAHRGQERGLTLTERDQAAELDLEKLEQAAHSLGLKTEVR